MAERVNIVDKHGKGYSIELFESEPFFAMRVYRGGVPVGYARCFVENGHVELADIRINGRAQRNILVTVLLVPFRRFLARNYQSRGIGSKLLKEIIAYARELGAVSIHGSLAGKPERLLQWFLRFGFAVEASTGKVVLRLDAAEH